MFKIVVCIKQVPDTADIKWTENNTIQREGVESIINPFDTYALETALRLKDLDENVKISVITMGPNQASEILKKAIAMGADEAFLISDRKFAGSDTLATSKTLSAIIREKIPDFNLIICGQFATDGDTAQTGPAIAQHLGLAQVTYVSEIVQKTSEFLLVKKEVEDGIETLKVILPCVLCVQKGYYEPRKALINGYIKSQLTQIPILTFEDTKLNVDQLGLKGSPTYVSAAFRPKQKTSGELINKENSLEYAKFLDDKIKEFANE